VTVPTVLHLLPTFGTGGLGACCLNMVRGWPVQATHHVLAPKYPAPWGTEEMLPEVAALVGAGNTVLVPRDLLMIPPVWAAAGAPKLRDLWKVSGPPSHVIVYNVYDLPLMQHLLAQAGYEGRVICHVGTVMPDDKQGRGALNSPLNWTSARETVFVPTHTGVEARTREMLGRNAKHLQGIIWNAADEARYAGPVRGSWVRRFGFAARLAPQKDWECLFDAWRIATTTRPDLKLHLSVAGEGGDRNRIMRLAEGLPVDFVGNVTPDRMPDFYRGLDAFVMAALPIEGFAYVLIEALLSRCYIVGTDVPGVREPFAWGGSTEMLAPDAAGLAERILALATDEDCQRRNAEVVEKVRARLSLPAMGSAYWRLG